MNDETHCHLLKIIQANLQISQRKLADATGVSLSKFHYCLKAIIERCSVKVKNIKAKPNKRVYTYYLTPKGMEERTGVSVRFLNQKIQECQQVKREISQFRRETAKTEVVLEMPSWVDGVTLPMSRYSTSVVNPAHTVQ